MPVLRRFKSFVVLIVITVLVAGCMTDSPTSNTIDVPAGQAEPSVTESRLIDDVITWIGDLILVPMPVATSPKQVQNASVLVTPQSGGTLTAKLSYSTYLGKKVSVIATLRIPPQAVSENVTIKMSINQDAAGVMFEPEGLRFRKTVLLDYDASGLSLLSTLTAPLNFYYLNYEGPCELIPNSGISVNLLKGSLGVDDARLNHFSAYAFGRRQ